MSENRSDIMAMQLATATYKTINKADKMVFLPRLNTFGRTSCMMINCFRVRQVDILLGHN